MSYKGDSEMDKGYFLTPEDIAKLEQEKLNDTIGNDCCNCPHGKQDLSFQAGGGVYCRTCGKYWWRRSE